MKKIIKGQKLSWLTLTDKGFLKLIGFVDSVSSDVEGFGFIVIGKRYDGDSFRETLYPSDKSITWINESHGT